MADYLAHKGLSTGRAQEGDWIDGPMWTPEAQERARLAAERKRLLEEAKREQEWMNRQADYQWYVGYGGTD